MSDSRSQRTRVLPMTSPVDAAPRGVRIGRGRLRRWVRAAGLMLVVAAVIGLVWGARWLFSAYRMDWSLRRGLALQTGADNPRDVQQALAQWEAESGPIWRGREDHWLNFVFWRGDASDPRVRRLLNHVTGVDFGDREKDWKRWRDARRQLQRGEQPATTAREAVNLTPSWKAPIGLTSWFTPILPIGGTLYVPSMGSGFETAVDEADGVVAVNGSTGDARLIFRPLDRGPTDILGLAAGTHVLFAACRNGMVYCITPEGELVWKASAGTKIASTPMALDVNRAGGEDVAVVTVSGRVVAFDGDSGKTLWTTPIDNDGRLRCAESGSASPDQAAVTAGLALIEPPRGLARALVATTGDGLVALLSANSGNMLWRQTLDAGFVAAPMGVVAPGGPDSAILVGDVLGRVWMIAQGQRAYSPVPAWNLTGAEDGGLIAGLRSTGRSGPARILACTAGSRHGGFVSLLDSTGTVWRNSIEGEIRSAPAVADVNADGRSEFLVASSVYSDNAARGRLTVLSADGHYLRRYVLDAACETPLVVADVDGNELLEVLVADKAGWLHCYSVGKFGRVEWGMSGGDPRGSRQSGDAFSYSQTPSGYQWEWKPGHVGSTHP